MVNGHTDAGVRPAPAPPRVEPSPFWELSNDLLVVLGEDLRIRAVNPAWAPRVGYPPDTIVGVPFGSVVHAEDAGALAEAARAGASSGATLRGLELRIRHADGAYRQWTWSASFDGADWRAVGSAVGAEAAHTSDAPWVADVGRRPSEHFYESVIDSMSRSVAVLDDHGVILATNAAWRQFAADNGGVAQHTGVGSDYLAACDAAGDREGDETAAGLRALLEDGNRQVTREYPCHSPDEQRWFCLQASRFDENGTARLVVQHSDVTVHRDAEIKAQLRRRLLDEVAAAVIGTDAAFRVTEWNRGAEELYGWTRQEALGRSAMELVVPEAAAVTDDAHDALERGERWVGDVTLCHRDGTRFPAHVRDTAILDENGAINGYVGVSIDVSERDQAEGELRSAQRYLAAVTDSMGEGLWTLDEEGRVVYLNPAAEDMLGWKLEELAGEVLHPIAHSRRADGSLHPIDECPIRASWREGATVRIDDDVFSRADGSLVAVQYTATPLETPEGVRGSVVVFSDITRRKDERESLEREVESLTWVTRIQYALAHDRFLLHAQPIIDLASGEVVQHELLIRMLDDEGGLVAPGSFLPAAEEHGIVREIDRWVVTQVAGLAARGHAVEFNLSAESIVDPLMADFVEDAFSATGIDASKVVVELTETAILGDEEAGRRFLQRVEALGCKIALDDFGTGYGSFTYLKRLPVDFLKIDIEFVRDLVRNKFSQQVVQAVVQLAAGLGKQTVAEGVEDEKSLKLLRDYGVDYAQGFAIGRPCPLQETGLIHSLGREGAR